MMKVMHDSFSVCVDVGGAMDFGRVGKLFERASSQPIQYHIYHVLVAQTRALPHPLGRHIRIHGRSARVCVHAIRPPTTAGRLRIIGNCSLEIVARISTESGPHLCEWERDLGGKERERGRPTDRQRDSRDRTEGRQMAGWIFGLFNQYSECSKLLLVAILYALARRNITYSRHTA